ncbi:MAG: SDR family NAD(P)-dependent oxidoreductase [Pseudomonadales bacterium]|nr:SDR family NAD(P)-dependent oxidoreductase [Pseudomonadales bacterium]
MSAFDLQDKVAIVTGGGSGIGEAITMAYARAGAHVVVAARKQERLDKAASAVRALERESLAISTDVTDPDQVNRLIEKTLEKFGRLDIMVANSGGGGFPPLLDATLADWDQQVALNLDSAFLCDVAAAKAMIAQGSGGKIINISSTAGINLNPGLAAYAAAKAGVINFTKTVALSWAGHGINVNCVAPGFVATPGIRKAGYVPSEIRKDGTKVPPLLMPNEPEHVADTCVFLASEASSHVTGEVMIVRAMLHMERSNDVARDRAKLLV